MVDKYVRPHVEDRLVYYQKGYRDYQRLNYLLTNRYGLAFQIEKEEVSTADIEDIKPEIMDSYLAGLQAELEKAAKADEKDMEVYPLEEIESYL